MTIPQRHYQLQKSKWALSRRLNLMDAITMPRQTPHFASPAATYRKSFHRQWNESALSSFSQWCCWDYSLERDKESLRELFTAARALSQLRVKYDYICVYTAHTSHAATKIPIHLTASVNFGAADVVFISRQQFCCCVKLQNIEKSTFLHNRTSQFRSHDVSALISVAANNKLQSN